MDLSRLTIRELTTLEDRLRLIRRGAEILVGLSKDDDLIVRLQPGEQVTIVTGWTFPHAAQVTLADPAPVGPVVLETRRFLPDEIFVPDADELVATLAPATEPEPALEPEAAPIAAAAQPKITGRTPNRVIVDEHEPGVLTGPLTEAERTAIIEAVKAGKSRREIALNLNRRLQTVALFITAWEKHPPAPTATKIDRVVVSPSSPRLDAAVMTGGPDASDAPDTGQAPAAASAPTTGAAPILPAAVARPASVSMDPVDDRPSRQRQIARILAVVRPRAGFDPELDLELAEAVARGEKINQIGLDLGIDSNDLKFRWSDLTSRLRDDRGGISIDDQKYLLLELRRKVRDLRGAAA